MVLVVQEHERGGGDRADSPPAQGARHRLVKVGLSSEFPRSASARVAECRALMVRCSARRVDGGHGGVEDVDQRARTWSPMTEDRSRPQIRRLLERGEVVEGDSGAHRPADTDGDRPPSGGTCQPSEIDRGVPSARRQPGGSRERLRVRCA